MQKKMGYILIAIALLHQVVGLIFYSSALHDILQAGILNAVVPPFWERDAAFWFLMFGGLLLLIGWVVQWLMDSVGTIPAFLGWGLLIVCVLGVILMPLSGFWLVIPLAIMMIRQADSVDKQLALTSP
ncbi:MAG: DUF6463 family protein [Chloroflexota bacterium]